MKNREEYSFESVKEYLNKNCTLIIAGTPCDEDRTHYISDEFSQKSIPMLYLDYEESSNNYIITYYENGKPVKRKATFVNLHLVMSSITFVSFKNVLVDITGLPHTVIMYLMFVLITKIKVAHLFAAYVKPEEYLNRTPSGKYELYTKTQLPRAISGMSSRSKEHEIIIPFLGFDGDRFNNVIEGMSYEEIDPVVGFPSDNPYWQIESLRNCMLSLKNTGSEENIRKCKANSIFDACQMLEEIITEKPNRNFVLVPLGTRPHSAACAIVYARHPNNVRIIYDFAEEAPIRSKGVRATTIYNLTPFLK